MARQRFLALTLFILFCGTTSVEGSDPAFGAIGKKTWFDGETTRSAAAFCIGNSEFYCDADGDGLSSESLSYSLEYLIDEKEFIQTVKVFRRQEDSADADGKILWEHAFGTSLDDFADLLDRSGSPSLCHWIQNYFGDEESYGGARLFRHTIEQEDIDWDWFLKDFMEERHINRKSMESMIYAQRPQWVLQYRTVWSETLCWLVYVKDLDTFVIYYHGGY